MENVMNGYDELEYGREEDCRSRSLRNQVRDEHAMDNDVEPLHSEGDEPDLAKYLRNRKGE